MYFSETFPRRRRRLVPWGRVSLWLAALGLPIVVALSSNAQGPLTSEPLPPQTEQLPAEQLVSEIRILGNDTISASQVADQLNTRVGRPFNRTIVQDDVRRLANLGWFVDVKPLYEATPQGRVVIFQVVERPTIRYVQYVGNSKIKDKNLAKETGLKDGGAIDPYAVDEGRRKIKEYYTSRGYNKVQVTILEGSKPTDKGIVYLINEGVAQKVWSVDFVGNEFVDDGRLKTVIKSKPPILKVIKGYLDRKTLEDDVNQLTAYYRAFGFFQAKVSRKLDFNKNGNWANLTFIIDEGPRYKVRSVRFLGNSKFEPEAMADAAKLSPGEFFEQSKVKRDALWLQELYGSHGYVFADIQPEPVFLEEPGELDLLYHIEEGERFRVGRIFVHIGGENPHTRIQTALNRMTIRPGDIMDIRELKASERRLMASSLFHSDPASGIRPKITYRIPEDDIRVPNYGGPGTTPQVASSTTTTRGQSPDNLGPAVLPPPCATAPRSAIEALSGDGLEVHVECEDLEHYQRWLESEKTQNSNVPQTAQQELIIRGQSPQQGQINSAYSGLTGGTTNPSYGGTLVGATGPNSRPVLTNQPNTPVRGYGVQPGVQPVQYTESIPPPAGGIGAIPGYPANAVPGYQFFPNGHFGLPGQPYPERTVDIFFDGQETQTGRLMLGVGINSDAGLVGNIVLDERNFDWRRPPRSWEDFRNGTAWRGAGQRFRVDASPGSQVNRYLVSFTEPYLFDSPVSLSLGGSFFDRRFRDWDEQRLGGRAALGYKWVERDVSTLFSYRGENVNVSDAPTGL